MVCAEDVRRCRDSRSKKVLNTGSLVENGGLVAFCSLWVAVRLTGSFRVQAMGLEFDIDIDIDIEFERVALSVSACENPESPVPRASPKPVDRRLAEVILLLRE